MKQKEKPSISYRRAYSNYELHKSLKLDSCYQILLKIGIIYIKQNKTSIKNRMPLGDCDDFEQPKYIEINAKFTFHIYVCCVSRNL